MDGLEVGEYCRQVEIRSMKVGEEDFRWEERDFGALG